MRPLRLAMVTSLGVTLAAVGLSASATPGNYQVTLIATGADWAVSPRRPINSAGQVILNSGHTAFLWNPVTANATGGTLVDLGGLAAPAPVTNTAIAINSFGQVIGTTALRDGSNTRPFLWTPDQANGAAGQLTAFLGDLTGTPTDINSSGEIGASGLLWQPISPNAGAGTPQWVDGLRGLVRINDLGQAIIGDSLLLFTPSSANGAAGSYIRPDGLPANSKTAFLDINARGVILGSVITPFGLVNSQAFLWMPGEPNGNTGSTTLIPLPANVLSMMPVALNAGGQIVGWMKRNDGQAVPFLYDAGTVYDLSIPSDGLRFGSDAGIFAVGINELGQIVVNALGNVYLLTPRTPSVPASGSVPVTIAANMKSVGFTVTGSGCTPGGYNTPQTLYWAPESNCTVAFLSSAVPSAGTRIDFGGWQDGIAVNPRNITAPASATTYTANVSTSYLLTVSANLQAGGTVAGGGWYPPGGQATLTATPASGYRVASFIPSATVTVTAPTSVTVNFSLILPKPPGSYQIGQVSQGGIKGGPINNFGQVAASAGSLRIWSVGFLWTPAAANAPAAGKLTQLGGLAQGINDSGQVAVSTATLGGKSYVWSPDIPNGNSGTAVPVLLDGSALAPAVQLGAVTILRSIDNSGRISGGLYFPAEIIGFESQYPFGFLWTPSKPNGAVGTISIDSPLAGAARFDDFGQAIRSSGSLFTPFTARGDSGTVTTIPGLPASTHAFTSLVDLNRNGAIVGSTCADAFSNCRMFLWTPVSPNSPTGTTAEIPMPPGFISVTPAALNASGDMVGSLSQPGGVSVPFLYTGGNFYDLSLLYDPLAGGSAGGINERGQIVVNTADGVYLLSLVPHAPRRGR